MRPNAAMADSVTQVYDVKRYHMNNLHKIIVVFVALLCGVSQVSSRNNGNAWNKQAQDRLADYIYLEAQRQLSLDNIDAYYELMRQAYEMSGKDLLIGNDMGLYTIYLAQGNDGMYDQGLKMIDEYFEAHPDDYYASMFYGSIADKLGLPDRSLKVWKRLNEIYPEKTEISMRLADAYLARTTDTLAQSNARKLLDRIEVSEGPSLALTARRVMSLMAQRDTANALLNVTNLVAQMPRSAEARVYAGDLYLSMGDNDAALKYYNEACEADPSSGLPYYKRALFYKQTGDSLGYDREVFHALELPDLDMDTKLEILTGFVKEQYTDSLQQPRINELFGKLIDMYPHEPGVHDLYSSYFVAIKDYASAAEQQEYVLDTDLSNTDRWRGLISLQYSAGQYEKALETADKAVKRFPQEPVYSLLAGQAAEVLQHYDQAASYLDRLVNNDSLDVDIRSQAITARGDVMYKSGDVKGAILMYEKALEINPANAMAMNNCAYFMACEGIDIDRAAELSRKSLSIDPDNESSLDTYAWIMFKKGDYKEAKTFIDRVFELDPEPTAELLQHRGDIYFMCGEPDKALEYWKEASKLDPNDELLQKKILHKTYFYK